MDTAKLLDLLGSLGVGMMRANHPGVDFMSGMGSAAGYALDATRQQRLDQMNTELFNLKKRESESQIADRERKAKADAQFLSAIGLMGAPTHGQNFWGQDRVEPSQLQQQGYDPAVIGLMGADADLARKVIGDRATQHEAGFTLQAGDVRYGGDGRVLARGPDAPLKPPQSRTRNVGGLEIFEEFNPKDGTWTKVSQAGRWKPDSAPQLTLSERRHDDEIDNARRAIRARFPKLDANEIRGRVNPAADNFNPPDAELRRLLHVATEKKFGDDAEHVQWGSLGLEPVPDSPTISSVPADWGSGPSLSGGGRAPDEGSGRWLGPTSKPSAVEGKSIAGLNFESLKRKADDGSLSREQLADLRTVDPVVYKKLRAYLEGKP